MCHEKLFLWKSRYLLGENLLVFLLKELKIQYLKEEIKKVWKESLVTKIREAITISDKVQDFSWEICKNSRLYHQLA